MRAREIFPRGSNLYLILDGEMCDARGITREDFLAGALSGGARIVQYRHKNISADAYEKNLLGLMEICGTSGARLIVNDHAAIAEKHELVLHLGQGDELPRDLKVPYGRSTHDLGELELALAVEPKPGYIALGTMFTSSVKPEISSNRQLIGKYLSRTQLPLVLIGGVTLDNVHLLPQGEEIFYAVISDAFRYGATRESIQQYVTSFFARHPAAKTDSF